MFQLGDLLSFDKEYLSFRETLGTGLRAPHALPIVVNGLSAGAENAFLLAAVRDALALGNNTPVLLVTENETVAQATVHLLSSGGIQAMHYKERDLVFHNMIASHDTERERLLVLSALLSGSCECVVTTLYAALTVTMPPHRLKESSCSLSLGSIIEPSVLARKLDALGFARVDMVESAGQFALRGGIVDLCPEAHGNPIRIEFFGDEIDRMEFFDPITQRVLAPCQSLSLSPAEEVLIDDEARAAMLKVQEKLIKKATDPDLLAKLSREYTLTKEGINLHFRDKYLGIIYPEHSTLLDYLDFVKEAVGARHIPILIRGTDGSLEGLKKREASYRGEGESLISLGALTKECAFYVKNSEHFSEFCEKNLPIHSNPFAGGVGTMRVSGLFGFRSRRTVSYGESPKLLFDDLATLIKGKYRILIITENERGTASLVETLTAEGILARELPREASILDLSPSTVYITDGTLAEGFELINARVCVLSMVRDSAREILRAKKRARIAKKTASSSARLMSYADLEIGDYVVHQNYGIGLFLGIETLKVDGAARDYITIQYAGTDKLLVPCERLEVVGKYIGKRDEDGTVKLSSMGGNDWSRRKSKAKSAAQNIAKELIALYARRQRTPGYAFPEECEMEKEFAEGFEFEETDSQLVAIEEIFNDMKKPVPMNRLLCGDVGFGKTEVALRAAFKAVVAGKQVAILVPTTILALQHYQTTLSRMRGYAVNVEMLSRFCTPKKQEKILRATKRGEIDILIGTHKLLSKSLQFRDLGLLIVDEEQRFGVSQKEKLKALAGNVDVLTLSATPIPRTLNMALGGISDMSILDEAPSDRHPVQTYVMEHDDGIIFDAIRRELDRNGQVLYLYNRIEEIDLVAGRIERAFPEARVTFAHGQMEREQLEDIWQMLVHGEIDILVCTTIIETGVDLPSANTLIIENADRMGLSQLHQLRGRVGRSPRQAYAYFTYRAGKVLSEVAMKRLSAIRAYAEFGAGFKIALCDLEIRGAGNLLGTEQHGHIESIGYDLYIKLLNEAVLEEQGVKLPPVRECQVELSLDAILPNTYIPSEAHRMEMYKKISLIETHKDLLDVTDEFLDRFGALPRSGANLVTISYVRAIFAKGGITRVSERSGGLILNVGDADLALLAELMSEIPGLTMRSSPSVHLTVRPPKGERALDTAARIARALEQLLNKEQK